jgi:homoserine O-acetyltransferase
MPDALGRGGSSKPSDGLKGQFPHYRYHDMVDLTHRLVTDGLKVAHLRLIMGSSLGCIQQFCGPSGIPDLMEGTVGLSCQRVEISGRNYILRHGAAELIRHDPVWNNGDYDETPDPLHVRGSRSGPNRKPGAHSGGGADHGARRLVLKLFYGAI